MMEAPDVTPRYKTPARKREKATTHKTVATRLHSLIVRHPGVCELDDTGACAGRLECAHIIRRARSGVRTDETNGLCLCSSHHAWLDNHLADLIEHVETTRGQGTYRALQAKADAYTEGPTSALLFWRAERRRLETIAKRMGILK
jgi:hypothetical protein